MLPTSDIDDKMTTDSWYLCIYLVHFSDWIRVIFQLHVSFLIFHWQITQSFQIMDDFNSLWN